MRFVKGPSVKHSIGGWLDSAQSRPQAIWHPFFGTLKSAPSSRELGRSGRIGRIEAETGPSIERFLRRAFARTAEVLAPSMPSGSTTGNGHVRTKRPSPVLGCNEAVCG
jgi:hypothetical protein